MILTGIVMAVLFAVIVMLTNTDRAESAFWKRNGWRRGMSGQWHPKNSIKWSWWEED